MCFYHDVNGEEYGKETKICVNIWRIQLLFASLLRGRNSFIFMEPLSRSLFNFYGDSKEVSSNQTT